MNSIRRLLGESDQDCFAPVLASASTRQALDRRKKRWHARTDKPDDESLTKESVVDDLKALADQLKGEMAKYASPVRVLAEAISNNSLVPFDAEITTSTVEVTNVVVKPSPPDKDPVLAAILGKSKPVLSKPPLEKVQAEKNQEFQGQGMPGPSDVQKAMEDAANGRELAPKVELVESSSMNSAVGMLQMESFSSEAPLLGQPQVARSDKVWGAFKKFVKTG